MQSGFAKQISLCALALVLGCGPAHESGDPVIASAFELTTASPDVAAPLWVRSPIVLQFSAAVDASSAGAGFRLESTAGPVEFTQRLDGQTLTLQIVTPPPAPTTLHLSITADLRDRAGRSALPTSRSWQLPVWHVSSADAASARAPLSAHARDVTWLAWNAEANGAAVIQVAQAAEQGIRNVEALPIEGGALLSDLAIDADGKPVVAWRGNDVQVARYGATGWQRLGRGPEAAAAGPPATPRVVIDDQSAILVAWPTAAGVELARWSAEGSWQRMTAWTTPLRIHAIDLAWSPAGAVLAALVEDSAGRDLQVHRFEAGTWRALAEVAEHDAANDVREIAVDVASDGTPVLAWTEVSDGTSRLYVSRFSAETGTFQGLGPALNVVPDSDVERPSLAAAGGAPIVAFRELSGGEATSYVARWNGSRFEVLGGSLGGRGAPSLAIGLHGEPLAAIARANGAGIELHHYNESPQPPFGLDARKPQPCTLPADSDPAFPKRLSETGCYADLATKTIAGGWISYELNSPLWSDGAWKRRFFSIPDGTTIGFTKTDAWEMPVGTMLGKEFWLQRDPSDPATRFIVETRLMIKRCEPGACRASWQGYSYQWNEAGDEGTLLDNTSETVFVDWPVNGGAHTHSYPGRDECTKCHALSAGGALGPRTQQLNRNYRYADVVDNQIRAIAHAGLFGNSQTPVELDSLFRLPTPSDPSYDLDARVRGYFDANCSHCHSPTSRWPVVDLRFDAPLRADDGSGTTGNICNMIVLGNADASILYVKLKARPGAVPEGFPGDTMPPIARLVPDAAQLPRIKTWIEQMTSCP